MSKEIKKTPKRGEIWLVNYNYKPNKDKVKELEIESKIKKIRPSLIVSNDIQNKFDLEIIVVPLSSKDLKKTHPHELLIKKNKENGLDEDSKTLFNRLRNIEKKLRLEGYIGVLDKETMLEVNEKLKLVLDLED